MLSVDIFSTALMNTSIEEGIVLRNKLFEMYPNGDFNVFYLRQIGDDDSAEVTVYATSDMNKTLKTEKGVKVVYEK